MSDVRIALALGSGGARGYAHIGAIEVLEERGFQIAGIAGSSMGALVGGLYAAGKLDRYTEWVRTIGHRDVLRLLDPALRGPGALRADKLMARVSELLDHARIEQLPIPYTAVATDLLARRAVWFQQGPVGVAIRASIAVPSAITPIVLNGRLLADGGLMDPVPIAPVASVRADAVVAVSLNGPRGNAGSQTPSRESADPRPGGGPRPATDPTAGLHTTDVLGLSMEAIEDVLTRYRLAGNPPDLFIEIPADACRSHDFHRAVEMIELGRRATAQALDSSALSPARGSQPAAVGP